MCQSLQHCGKFTGIRSLRCVATLTCIASESSYFSRASLVYQSAISDKLMGSSVLRVAGAKFQDSFYEDNEGTPLPVLAKVLVRHLLLSPNKFHLLSSCGSFLDLSNSGNVNESSSAERALFSWRLALDYVSAACCRLTCAVILVLIIVLSEHYTETRLYYPFFGEQNAG